ncbi:MAG: hypothetical protein GWN33_11325 [Gammaproteobacteria bacterium]|nr:hypothetical protein [Gammaproteobacteria bacterium]
MNPKKVDALLDAFERIAGALEGIEMAMTQGVKKEKKEKKRKEKKRKRRKK